MKALFDAIYTRFANTSSGVWRWADYDTIAPSGGFLEFNSLNLAACIVLRVNNIDYLAVNQKTWLFKFDPNLSCTSTLRVYKQSDHTKYVEYTFNNISDETTYVNFNLVAYVSHAGVIAPNDLVVLKITAGLPVLDLFTLATGGMFNTVAKEGASYPYIVFQLIAGKQDFDSNNVLEDCIIQFNIFSKTATAEQACDIYEALKTAFDFYALVVVGYATLILKRETSRLLKIDNVWQYNVTYRCILVH